MDNRNEPDEDVYNEEADYSDDFEDEIQEDDSKPSPPKPQRSSLSQIPRPQNKILVYKSNYGPSLTIHPKKAESKPSTPVLAQRGHSEFQMRTNSKLPKERGDYCPPLVPHPQGSNSNRRDLPPPEGSVTQQFPKKGFITQSSRSQPRPSNSSTNGDNQDKLSSDTNFHYQRPKASLSTSGCRLHNFPNPVNVRLSGSGILGNNRKVPRSTNITNRNYVRDNRYEVTPYLGFHPPMKLGPSKAIGSVARRVASAQRVTVNDLKNRIAIMLREMEDLKRENRALNHIQNKQNKSIRKWEGVDAELPRLLQQHKDEIKSTQLQLKKSLAQNQTLEEKMRGRDRTVARMANELETLKSIAAKEDLQERNDLQEQLEMVMANLTGAEKRIRQYMRHVEILEKNHQHKVDSEKQKFIKANNHSMELRQEITKLKVALKDKDRMLNYIQMRSTGRNLMIAFQESERHHSSKYNFSLVTSSMNTHRNSSSIRSRSMSPNQDHQRERHTGGRRSHRSLSLDANHSENAFCHSNPHNHGYEQEESQMRGQSEANYSFEEALKSEAKNSYYKMSKVLELNKNNGKPPKPKSINPKPRLSNHSNPPEMKESHTTLQSNVHPNSELKPVTAQSQSKYTSPSLTKPNLSNPKFRKAKKSPSPAKLFTLPHAHESRKKLSQQKMTNDQSKVDNDKDNDVQPTEPRQISPRSSKISANVDKEQNSAQQLERPSNKEIGNMQVPHPNQSVIQGDGWSVNMTQSHSANYKNTQEEYKPNESDSNSSVRSQSESVSESEKDDVNLASSRPVHGSVYSPRFGRNDMPSLHNSNNSLNNPFKGTPSGRSHPVEPEDFDYEAAAKLKSHEAAIENFIAQNRHKLSTNYSGNGSRAEPLGFGQSKMQSYSVSTPEFSSSRAAPDRNQYSQFTTSTSARYNNEVLFSESQQYSSSTGGNGIQQVQSPAYYYQSPRSDIFPDNLGKPNQSSPSFHPQYQSQNPGPSGSTRDFSTDSHNQTFLVQYPHTARGSGYSSPNAKLNSAKGDYYNVPHPQDPPGILNGSPRNHLNQPMNLPFFTEQSRPVGDQGKTYQQVPIIKPRPQNHNVPKRTPTNKPAQQSRSRKNLHAYDPSFFTRLGTWK